MAHGLLIPEPIHKYFAIYLLHMDTINQSMAKLAQNYPLLNNHVKSSDSKCNERHEFGCLLHMQDQSMLRSTHNVLETIIYSTWWLNLQCLGNQTLATPN